MSRDMADLSDRFRPIAGQLIDECTKRGIRVVVTFTLRTQEEEAAAVASGHSSTMHSRHLTGDAIDIAPVTPGTSQINWDAGPGWKPKEDPGESGSPIDRAHVKEPWATMGECGERLGLRWGGRWHKPFDPGHFEYQANATTVTANPELMGDQ